MDLLVTRKKRDGRPVGLQVKFSRNYWFIKELAGKVQATSWFRLDPAKIRNSTADLWVFVIITLKHKQHFVVIPTRELAKRIPKKCGKRWDLYLWVYPGKKCYNMRDVCNEDRVAAWTVASGQGSRLHTLARKLGLAPAALMGAQYAMEPFRDVRTIRRASISHEGHGSELPRWSYRDVQA